MNSANTSTRYSEAIKKNIANSRVELKSAAGSDPLKTRNRIFMGKE